MNKSQLLFIILILLLLSPLIESRRGSRSRSKGRGSSGGGGGGLAKSCTQRCVGDQDYDECIQQCNSSNSMYYGIIGGVLGFVALLTTTLVCCCCCRKAERKFNQLKQEYNNVDSGSLSKQQFIHKRNLILNLLNSSTSLLNFTETTNSQSKPITATATITNEKDFLTQINLTGNDSLGKWKGSGAIVSRNQGYMFIWFNKQYLEQNEAKDPSKFKYIIYESSPIDFNTGIQGRWFGLISNEQQNGGTWFIGNTANNMGNSYGMTPGNNMPYDMNMGRQTTVYYLNQGAPNYHL